VPTFSSCIRGAFHAPNQWFQFSFAIKPDGNALGNHEIADRFKFSEGTLDLDGFRRCGSQRTGHATHVAAMARVKCRAIQSSRGAIPSMINVTVSLETVSEPLQYLTTAEVFPGQAKISLNEQQFARGHHGRIERAARDVDPWSLCKSAVCR
jgi:hypothetical protein